MKKELRIFLTAVMFFTRIPCPGWVDHSPEYITKSLRYFPLIGILVGGTGAAVYVASSYIFPHTISLLLSMISTIYITGALHEDGLADTCDGFGGGFTKEQILHIMKDSQIGTYGVLGLLSILALKFFSLNALAPGQIPLLLIAGHTISRFAASTLLYTHKYARENGTGKINLSDTKMSKGSLFTESIFCLIPLILFFNPFVFLLLIPVFVTGWYLGKYFQKRIGGQTGDLAGATQQICEVVFYLGYLALWKFI